MRSSTKTRTRPDRSGTGAQREICREACLRLAGAASAGLRYQLVAAVRSGPDFFDIILKDDLMLPS